MGSKQLSADVNFAWPTASIAVMGAQGAVGERSAADLRAKLVEQYETVRGTPYAAAARGYIDAVITPRSTRSHIVRALRALRTRRATVPDRRHGNIPL